ncbi:MAG: dCTP deaminase [Planctomycetaceae bacterium]|nr:MAG: dCTP deaminase [Planctomycetaceae bacterium]
MILSGEEIRRHQGSDIVIDPFDPQDLNPNSYNLTLHDELLVYEEVVLDAAAPNRFTRLRIPGEGMTLHPGQLYLGRTVERTETERLVPRIQGRSSLARLGLFICPGGSLGSVGYRGTWTLEMFVIQPVKVYPAMKVCQIYFHELVGDVGTHDGGKYQDSWDIQPSQMYREFGGEAARNQQLELGFDDRLRF